MKRKYIVLVAAIILAVAILAALLPMLDLGFASRSQTDSSADLDTEMYIQATSLEGGIVSIPSVTYVQSPEKDSYVLSDTNKSVSGYIEVKTPDDLNAAMDVLVDFENPGSWMFVDTMSVTIQRDVSYIVLGSPGIGSTNIIIEIGPNGVQKWYNWNSSTQPTISGHWKVWGYRDSDHTDYYTVQLGDFYRGFILLVDVNYEMQTGYNIIKMTHGPEDHNVIVQNVKDAGIDVSGGDNWQLWGIGQPSSYNVNDPDAYRPETVYAGTIYDSTSGIGVSGRPSTNIPVKTSLYEFNIDVKYKSKINVVPDRYHGDNMVSNVVFFIHEKYATVKFQSNGGSGSMEDQAINTNNNLLRLNTFSAPSGKTFVGWVDSIDPGNKYPDGGIVSNINAIVARDPPQLVLNAQWASSRTVVFNQPDATKSSSPSSTEWVENVVIADLVSIPERIGYAFSGFYTTATGEGLQIYDKDGKIVGNVSNYTTSDKKPASSIFAVEGDLTLYARWVVLYTVTVEAGLHSTASATSEKGNSGIPIRDITITADTGYYFPEKYLAGYDTPKNGVTISRVDSTSLKISGSPTADTAFDGLPALTPKAYTVTLNNGDSASPSTSSVTVTYDSSGFDAITPPTWSGYAFAGYYLVSPDGVKLIDPSNMASFVNATVDGYLKDGKWARDGNVTIYAMWGHNLVYDKNGGDGAVPNDPKAYLNGEKATVAGKNTLSKSGSVFVCWNTQADGEGTDYLPGSEFTMADKLETLYAKWALERTITFNANGGTGEMDSQIVPSGIPTPLNVNAFTRTGYAFVGWAITAEGDKVYDDGQSVTLGEEGLSLYALWVKTYTLTFEMQGHGDQVDPQTIPSGQKFTAPTPAPTATGYTFGGWYNEEGCTSEFNFNVGASADDTAYAKWTVSTASYTVKFHGNESTGGMMSDEVFLLNEEKALTTNAFTRTGYAFVGWATTAEGDKVYADGQTVSHLSGTDGAIVDLYAVWGYTLTYSDSSKDEGLPPAPVAYKAGSTVTVAGAGTMVKTGYTLVSWNTESGGTGTDYSPGSTFKMPGQNTSLHSKWAVNELTVIFYGNGNTGGSMTNQVIKSTDDGKNLKANGFIKTGYVLTGWNTASDGTGVSFAAGASVADRIATPVSKLVLYAQWEGATTVSFDHTDGTGTMSPQKVPTGVSTALKPNTFTREGYTFIGWALTDGGEKAYDDGGNINTSADITLYAVWSENVLTVTFNGNGSTSGSMDQQTIEYVSGSYTLTANTFIRDSYTFNGWNTAADGSGDSFSDGANVKERVSTPASSLVLYAQWEPVVVTGVSVDETASVTVGKTVQLTATITPANALDKAVTWSSSDTNVATVDETGLVTGVLSGTVTITVTTHDGSYTDTCEVTVS